MHHFVFKTKNSKKYMNGTKAGEYFYYDNGLDVCWHYIPKIRLHKKIY